jgi:hypothetical protein
LCVRNGISIVEGTVIGMQVQCRPTNSISAVKRRSLRCTAMIYGKAYAALILAAVVVLCGNSHSKVAIGEYILPSSCLTLWSPSDNMP